MRIQKLNTFNVYIIFSLIIFSFAINTNAQNIVGIGNKLPLVGYWSKGISKNVSCTYITSKEKDGQISNTIRKTECTWEITDSTETNYIINYTLKNFNPESISDSFLIAFMQVLKGVPIKYCTSETGVFDSIINIGEVSKACIKGIDASIESLKWKNTGIAQLNRNKLKLILSDLISLKSSIEEELLIIHYFLGVEFELGKQYDYDSELPSLIGGENYPSTLSFKMTTINEELDNVNFSGYIIPNNATFLDIFYKNYSIFCSNYGLPIPSKSQIKGINTSHKFESSYSLKNGWPLKITYTKINNTPNSNNTESIILEFS